jgi:hypothetical protein
VKLTRLRCLICRVRHEVLLGTLLLIAEAVQGLGDKQMNRRLSYGQIVVRVLPKEADTPCRIDHGSRNTSFERLESGV